MAAWDGRLDICVQGLGVMHWLRKHFAGRPKGPFGALAGRGCYVDGPQSRIEFTYMGGVAATAREAVQLALAAIEALPDFDLLEDCSIDVCAESGSASYLPRRFARG